MVVGKIVHIAIDAVLISAVLAGIKKSTGYTVATNRIGNPDLRTAVTKFLTIGEVVVESSVTYISTSAYFEKTR
nr:5530_t:CDS:2 [Entrophospora candida]CAG8492618.1 372_t:CDS:2 [Entrophospora candida]